MIKKYLKIAQTVREAATELRIRTSIPFCLKKVIRVKRKTKVAVAKPDNLVKKR